MRCSVNQPNYFWMSSFVCLFDLKKEKSVLFNRNIQLASFVLGNKVL